MSLPALDRVVGSFDVHVGLVSSAVEVEDQLGGRSGQRDRRGVIGVADRDGAEVWCCEPDWDRRPSNVEAYAAGEVLPEVPLVCLGQLSCRPTGTRPADVLVMDEVFEAVGSSVGAGQPHRRDQWRPMTETLDEGGVGRGRGPLLLTYGPAGQGSKNDAGGGWVSLTHDEVRHQVAGVPTRAQRRRVWAHLAKEVGQRRSFPGGEGAVVRLRGRCLGHRCSLTAAGRQRQLSQSTAEWGVMSSIPALDPVIAARLKRDEYGLFPAVAQQYDTGEVLMVGWMNDEALQRTLTSGRATYFSRSRQAYWQKGDTSGNVQLVKEVRLDCDGDTVLVMVDQVGPACHTGARTCFDDGELSVVAPPVGTP